MKRPHEVHLSREEGEALRQRLDRNALTAADRQVLGHVLEWYFWLIFTVREAKLSLKRLRTLLFRGPSKPRQGPSPASSAGACSGDGGMVGGPPQPQRPVLRQQNRAGPAMAGRACRHI
jgi:hypothetical protein